MAQHRRPLRALRRRWRLGVGLAAVATAVGVVRTGRRREWVLLAATAATVGIYVVVSNVSIAYNGAKALVIAAPLLMLVGVAGLLIPARRPLPRALLAVLAASFAVAAATSSTLVLRGASVRPDTQAAAFSQLRDAVRGQSTVFLGRDNYAAWELRTTGIGYLGNGARAGQFGSLPQAGAAPDNGIDSLTSKELGVAELLVAPNTLYASMPGPEFREVLRNRWYRLYRRTRESPPRFVLDEEAEPGAILDCSSLKGRAAVRAGGRAFVRPAPILGPIGAWTFGARGPAAT